MISTCIKSTQLLITFILIVGLATVNVAEATITNADGSWAMNYLVFTPSDGAPEQIRIRITTRQYHNQLRPDTGRPDLRPGYGVWNGFAVSPNRLMIGLQGTDMAIGVWQPDDDRLPDNTATINKTMVNVLPINMTDETQENGKSRPGTGYIIDVHASDYRMPFTDPNQDLTDLEVKVKLEHPRDMPETHLSKILDDGQGLQSTVQTVTFTRPVKAIKRIRQDVVLDPSIPPPINGNGPEDLSIEPILWAYGPVLPDGFLGQHKEKGHLMVEFERGTKHAGPLAGPDNDKGRDDGAASSDTRSGSGCSRLDLAYFLLFLVTLTYLF